MNIVVVVAKAESKINFVPLVGITVGGYLV